ncbi:MAG TPA: argininosuccinate lyase [Desulfomonilaceae bacterium]|nr:argininosuccinate lyase [Desulfomonilaceae bacterium]
MANDGKKSRLKVPRRSGQSTGIRKGRFKTGMDSEFAVFNASIGFDRRLYAEDILGSVAHVRMLGRQGIIAAADADVIEKGLREVLTDIGRGKLEFSEELEDVHINVEEALKAKIGDVAGRLHTGRSRNDQVVLDLRLYLRNRSRLIQMDLLELMDALVNQADAYVDAIMPGYTHLQRAQPVRLSHHLLAYFEMFRRDWERFGDAEERMNRMPLGAAALAGTTFPIDRDSVAQELGFPHVANNSMDAVSDRDFAAEFLFNSCLIMMHLSRLSEELIIWSTSEFAFCSLPDAFCSGSSIMPQKKNPDACELIRGKTGRVYGDLVALLTTLKALPLAYNKDLQEDKEPVFDAADTVRASVGVMAGLIPGIEFNRGRMLDAASDPALAATDLADDLARQGVPFRNAHATIGKMIREAHEANAASLPSPEDMVEARNHTGGTARKQVMSQIRAARAFLKSRTQVPENRKGTGKRKY